MEKYKIFTKKYSRKFLPITHYRVKIEDEC